MAADFHLDLKSSSAKIEGESVNKGYEGHIQLHSWGLGVSNHGTADHGSGMGQGKASYQDFHFSLHSSKASCKLHHACATGTHIDKAVLTCRKTGKKDAPVVYQTFTFYDLVISSYQVSGSEGGGLPMENFTFNFSKIEHDYLEQDEKGATKSVGKIMFDIKKNTSKV